MTCQSVRTLFVGPDRATDGNFLRQVERSVEEVQCLKHSEHKGVWHAGVLEDGTAIAWMGASSSDIPDRTLPLIQ